uniref:Uncharacterized LOC110967689 n=1 Tax=Acanthochromis polyacanthus TaxID=80966 RepID=A0A3Q1FSZ0_9TELE
MILFVANVFLLWLNEVSQPVSVQTLNLGDSATIQCYIKSLITTRVWYKLTTGRKLQLVASFDPIYLRSVYADEFKHRYSVQSDGINSHLSITATSWDDIGTYFCGVMKLNDIHFGSGTFLMLKGAKMISDSVVQQPKSQSVQSGDSVTLSCSVHSGQCPAQQISVIWLKNSADHSAPEMIYSSGNQNNTCQTFSGETTCVYNHTMRNFSPEDAGIYHCVVTSCGQILFGNGTTITNRKTVLKTFELSPPVIALMLSNIILGVVVLFLVWTLCKTRRNDSADTGSSGGDQTSDVIYAPVSSAHRNLASRQATKKHTGDSVIYSNIRFSERNREVSS